MNNKAFETSQKYKEGKFIVELAHLIKDNGWEDGAVFGAASGSKKGTLYFSSPWSIYSKSSSTKSKTMSTSSSSSSSNKPTTSGLSNHHLGNGHGSHSDDNHSTASSSSASSSHSPSPASSVSGSPTSPNSISGFWQRPPRRLCSNLQHQFNPSVYTVYNYTDHQSNNNSLLLFVLFVLYFYVDIVDMFFFLSGPTGCERCFFPYFYCYEFNRL